MVVLVLDQLCHVVVHLHFPGRPVLVQEAQNAVAVAAHAHEQIRKGHAVVHEFHHLIAHKLKFRVDDHVGPIGENADQTLVYSDLRGRDGPPEAIVPPNAFDAVKHICEDRTKSFQFVPGHLLRDLVEPWVAQQQNFPFHKQHLLVKLTIDCRSVLKRIYHILIHSTTPYIFLAYGAERSSSSTN